jgi:teichuronic acid biosynthesis glycosyltransferase TuaG
MSHPPSVSVVMPAYNAAGYIEAAIASVMKQTFTDWELLVINDCSTDDTPAIVERHHRADSRIRLITLPRNMGAPAGPRNIGIQTAQGRWIAFLDSDDLWHPDKLRIQLLALERTGAGFCSTQMVDFRSGEMPQLRTASPDQIEWISYWQQLVKFRTPTSSVVADRELLLRFPFNEAPAYKAREDLDCWLHCHEALGRSIKITAPMMGYRIIEGQISGKKWIMLKRHFHVLRHYRRFSGRRFTAPEALAFTLTHFGLAFYYRLVRSGL